MIRNRSALEYDSTIYIHAHTTYRSVAHWDGERKGLSVFQQPEGRWQFVTLIGQLYQRP
jgi:hypothetical protein